jgi:hypothetical protein
MRRFIPMLAAAVLLVLSAQAVSADALNADGDGLAPVANGRLNLGWICHGVESSAVVAVAVRATGHPNGRQVFDNGATVATSASIVSGDGVEATAAEPTVQLPATWRSQPNGTMSDTVAWEVGVTPTTLGRYRATVAFAASGENRFGDTITRTRRMNVVARVRDCTAPVLDAMPADVVLEASGPDGADLDYAPPTANDAVDGTVAVTCDVPSGSRLPIGSTTVTCTAADAAGNVAAGNFTALVVDTTAPVMDPMPASQVLPASDATGASATWPMPSATDLVDGSVAVMCDRAPGSWFAVGTTNVTCSAADGAGNVASASFTVTVDPYETMPDPAPEAPDPDPSVPPIESSEEPDEGAPGVPSVETPPAVLGGVLPDTSLRPEAGATGAGVGMLLLAAAALLGLAAAKRGRAHVV